MTKKAIRELIPQGWFLMKFDTLRAVMIHLEEKNYGLAEKILEDINLNGGEQQ